MEDDEGIVKKNLLTRVLDVAGVNVMAAELSLMLPVRVLYLRSAGSRLVEEPFGTATLEGNKFTHSCS